MTECPRLHVPSEPDRDRFHRRVLEGATLDQVIVTEDGITSWLWERWRVLDRCGMDHTQFLSVVRAYRRELWLWLMGERSWAQCCSGLIGRVGRRLARP